MAVVAPTVASLWDQTRADLVVVAVPELAIASVMEDVLEAPWTILMEKPVGLDLQSAEATGASASRRGRTVFVGLNRRHLSSTCAAIDDLREAGERFIHVQDQQDVALARRIGQPETVVANWMYANSIHLVDYLLAFGRGTVTAVEVVRRWDPARPGIVLAQVSFSSGDIGLYEAIWNGPGPWACTVSTPERRWEMRPLEQARFQRAGERALNVVEMSAADAEFKPGFRLQAERVVQAVRGGPVLVPRIEDGLRTMRLVAEIYG
jgi:predicted dehydrogenase